MLMQRRHPPTQPGSVTVEMPEPSLDSEVRRWTASLLWEACRRYPDKGKIAAAISSGADTPAASLWAERHGIAPLLWRALGSAGASDALGEAEARLRAVAEAHRMEALLLFPRAVSVALEPLIDGGLEPLVLKGPTLATRYPEPGLRPMSDIDVLLPARDHARALRLLEGSGWTVARAAGRDRYDTVLVHSELPSLALELHYGLESSYERVTKLDVLALWDRREPIDCLGIPAFGLPVPEELVMLCAHAGKPYHGFTRLVWIADLAMVVGCAAEAGQPVQWERVRSVAEAGCCLTLVSAALALARRAGVQAPEPLFPLPAQGWRATALRRLLDVSWPMEVDDPAAFHLRYALTDGWWRRERLVVGSGHGMPTGQRVRWSAAAPVEALSRSVGPPTLALTRGSPGYEPRCSRHQATVSASASSTVYEGFQLRS